MRMGLIRRQIEITNDLGLHLRAAGKFAGVAQRYQAVVLVRRNGQVADGKSILDLAILAAECGARLDLEADGPDAEASLAALCELVEARFHENGTPG
jgi:phosphocarrier protein HPr